RFQQGVQERAGGVIHQCCGQPARRRPTQGRAWPQGRLPRVSVRPGIASLDAFFFFLDRGSASVKNFGGVCMKKSDEGAPVVVGKAYDFVLWLLPKVENFPKAHRFTVGDRLTMQGLDLLTALARVIKRRP